MLPRGSGNLRQSALLPVLCLVAGCATSKLDAVRELPPAPLVVLVDWSDGESDTIAVRYGDETVECRIEEMRELLADELRLLDAGSRVVTRKELGDDACDVTVTFEPKQEIAFAHEGTARFVAAGGLWLITWIGGLLVEDSTYSVAMDASCRFSLTEGRSFNSRILSDTVDLSFFERNDLISWPGLQSLVLPPFWTSDQADKTSRTLRRSAMRIVARQIAEELKSNFEKVSGSNFGCSVKLVEPAANGARVNSSTMPFALEIDSLDEVLSVLASVNGGTAVDLEIEKKKGLGQAVTATGVLQGIDPEYDSWVRVEVSTARDDHTRTFRFAARR